MLGSPPDVRTAQTFTEPNGGQLTGVELFFRNQVTNATGNYLLQINTVDANTGVPTNNTIASTQLSASAVGNNADLVFFAFGTPPTLVAGRQYAIVLSRPGGSGAYEMLVIQPGPCPGGELFWSSNATAPFNRFDPTADIYYRTFISP